MNINIAITRLASTYEELNKYWGNDTCAADVYQAYRQKRYRDVYEQLKGVNIESIAIKIIADSVSDKVLSRLRGLIQENIQIYETRKSEFESIEFDKLYRLWEDYLFGDKRELLLRDKEMIKDYPYPTERDREILLKENQRDINELDNERSDLYRSDSAWIGKSFYKPIYELSCSFTSILDSYFPVEQDNAPIVTDEVDEPDETRIESVNQEEIISQRNIDPDEIFKRNMFEKFQALEARLIKDGYLDENLNWLPKHKNDKADIKRLVTFLTGLIDSNYFMPNRDSAIKAFFESRYHITIGQNFERKRREQFISTYKMVFYDYPF